MKKHLLSMLLVPVLAFTLLLPALAAGTSPAGSGADRFKVRHTYTSGQFIDVPGSAWFAMPVQACYEFGLMNGAARDAFVPDRDLTVAEAAKLADCLASIYETGSAVTPYGVWYRAYVDDALNRGILTAESADYSATITRAQFAAMIARALPAEAFQAVNSVEDNAIPDVSVSDSFGSAVYRLYRAGIMTGSDKFGTFKPDDALSRAEAAAVSARVADAGFRKSITLPKGMTGADIFKKCDPAVFYLERYDSEGTLMGIGSGFFISRDGLAVTNYHVIDGASAAAITTADGKEYQVKGICGYDKTADIAILQINGSGFPYLDIADSSALKVGAQLYVIGSPLGLKNTISDGIVSNVMQKVNGSDFIQFSAPISMGSGGGPVLNTMGQVVGVSCLTVLSGQTLNFAVPINAMKTLDRTGAVPLITIVAKNASATVYYKSFFPVPDYGVFVGTQLYKSTQDKNMGVKTYYYKLSDITVSDSVAVDGYVAQLKQNGFKWQSSYKNDTGNVVDVYNNADFSMSVHFGTDNLNGTACRFVAIH